MPLFRRPRSPYWWYDFTAQGHRLRGSTGTADKAAALIVEATLRLDALLQAVTGRRPEMTLDTAAGRYLEEVARHQPSAHDTARMLERLIARLGGDARLSGLTADRLASYVARRRGDRAGRLARPKDPKKKAPPDRRRLVSNATVNRDLELLRRLLYRADKVWRVAVAEVNWKDLLLPEADGRTRTLSAGEERRLFAALRPDHWPLVIFAALSGLRRTAVVELTWRQVDLEGLTMTVRLKSKQPGGRRHVVPISPPMAAILQGEQGRHKERVFTYLCGRTRRDPHGRQLQVKGRRYPFTRNGWRKAWGAALAAAGIEDFRFHDLRHTAASRLLAATGNLKAVQEMLGHTEIATTVRYTHVQTAELREMMTRAHAASAQPAVKKAEGE